MLITIDTNILIWGVAKVSHPDQTDMIPRAVAFLDWADRQNHKIALTCQSVSEYLVGFPIDQMDLQLEALGHNFRIFEYNSLAARIAAEIRSDKDYLKELRQRKTRACISSDIAIVATAKAHGIDIIYSNDSDVQSSAKRCNLPASPLPSVEEMKPLGGADGKQSPKASRQADLFSDETN